jgi:hypothetical protein
MRSRLRGETKDLDVAIGALTAELGAHAARAEAASLSLRHAQTERTRARAAAQALASQLDGARGAWRTKRERMEAAIAAQEAKLHELQERDKKRLTLSLMPRVRCAGWRRGGRTGQAARWSARNAAAL